MGMSLRGYTKVLSWHKRVPKEESEGITGFPQCSEKSIGSSQIHWGHTAVTELPAMCCRKCVTLTEDILHIFGLCYRCRDWGMHRGVGESEKVSYKLAVSELQLLPLFNSKTLNPELN